MNGHKTDNQTFKSIQTYWNEKKILTYILNLTYPSFYSEYFSNSDFELLVLYDHNLPISGHIRQDNRIISCQMHVLAMH